MLKTPTCLPKTPCSDNVLEPSCLLLLILLLLYKFRNVLYKLLRLYYKRKATNWFYDANFTLALELKERIKSNKQLPLMKLDMNTENQILMKRTQ